MQKVAASFRDPSGQVYESDKGQLVRTINKSYAEHWCAFTESGLANALVETGNMVAFTETENSFNEAWKTLVLDRLPFISFPWEWCFSQLKDAALLTLDIQRQALNKGLILKDATAFNIQFQGTTPRFIDHLSFEKHKIDSPWEAYRQFCSHFLAPLALMTFSDIRDGQLSKIWIDGVPLDYAVQKLPYFVRFNPSLYLHLTLHARMQKKCADTREHAKSARQARVPLKTVCNLVESLTNCIQNLSLPNMRTEWGDYYSDTNYSETADSAKLAIVERIIASLPAGVLGLDLGANTGKYSCLMQQEYATVLAVDVDPLAVERHYLHLKRQHLNGIQPLVMDITNASPGIGLLNAERPSFISRCKADCLLALAVIHHLVITAGIPLDRCAALFASLLRDHGTLILEFVPKGDSQVDRLLAVRRDIFTDYSLEGLLHAFTPYFDLVSQESIKDSMRTIFVLNKR